MKGLNVYDVITRCIYLVASRGQLTYYGYRFYKHSWKLLFISGSLCRGRIARHYNDLGSAFLRLFAV